MFGQGVKVFIYLKFELLIQQLAENHQHSLTYWLDILLSLLYCITTVMLHREKVLVNQATSKNVYTSMQNLHTLCWIPEQFFSELRPSEITFITFINRRARNYISQTHSKPKVEVPQLALMWDWKTIIWTKLIQYLECDTCVTFMELRMGWNICLWNTSYPMDNFW